MTRFYARSASDRADDWPFWFVADRHFGGINRTAEVVDHLGYPRGPGAVLCFRADAERLAEEANARPPA